MKTDFKRLDFDAEISKERCKKFRRRILEISQQVTALHAAGAFSCMELVEACYFWLMRRDDRGNSPDTFLMSKGHGCMAQYVALEELGVLTRHDLDRYCKPDGRLGCHPDYGNPGIEASTGSLGHGLSMVVGMALADKARKEERDIFVVMSDGELQEGSVWEALLMAPAFGATRICAFVDLNDLQSLGRTSETHPNLFPLAEKLQSFGWEVADVSGHDSGAIVRAAEGRSGKKPFIAIARTTKGKGVSFMENQPIWHYRSPNAEEYRTALAEIERGLR